MSSRNLRPSLPLVAPSMLKCNFGNLESEVAQLAAAGARSLHWDVMDGHFVPNLSYGALLIKQIRPLTNLIFDAHLMISEPVRYLDEYIEAGCDWITLHIEAAPEPVATLRRIRAAGRLAGVSLNPETPVNKILPLRGECDLVLVMSVHPGFGGQSYLPGSTNKVREVRREFGPDVLISIDGGIAPSTIGDSAMAGADVFVAGSAIFDAPDYAQALRELEQLGGQGRG